MTPTGNKVAGLIYNSNNTCIIERKRKQMKKKVLALAVILAMIVGVTNIAMAADTTSGSIKFKTGSVIINPPPEDTTDPGGTDYNRFFFTHNVKKNLYFGMHELTVYGAFNSADEGQTSDVGMYTGAEVINPTETTTSISVEISRFKVNGTGSETLAGAELKLVAKAAMAAGGGTPYDLKTNVVLMPILNDGSAMKVLTVDSGREVKAAWSGVLTTQAGSAVLGTAQATLTWTSSSTP